MEKKKKKKRKHGQHREEREPERARGERERGGERWISAATKAWKSDSCHCLI